MNSAEELCVFVKKWLLEEVVCIVCKCTKVVVASE